MNHFISIIWFLISRPSLNVILQTLGRLNNNGLMKGRSISNSSATHSVRIGYVYRFNIINQLSYSLGQTIVPVTNCGIKYHNAMSSKEMKFSEYLDYWLELIASGHDYSNHECLYLKDWHFVENFPDYESYKTPIYFESDWLNDFWEYRRDKKDDYKFVYMGPKNSWTPLHTDVYGSFSWSANIVGKKKWFLISPETQLSLNYKINPLNLNDLSNQELMNLNVSQVIQNAGETIFIPSGWVHQVINLEDTISINHNWFNATNLHLIWQNLLAALSEVENELHDIKSLLNKTEWSEEVQKMLLIHHGLDFNEFVNLLKFRITKLQEEVDDELNFRVKHEQSVLVEFLEEPSFKNVILEDDYNDLITLLHKI